MMMSRRYGAKLMETAVTHSHLLNPRVPLVTENIRVPAMGVVRVFSKMTFEKKKTTEEKGSSGGKADQGNKGEQLIVSYWGVKPMKITKEDGTEWKWSCFRVHYIFGIILELCGRFICMI